MEVNIKNSMEHNSVLKKTFLLLTSTVVNVITVYFPFPFYIFYISSRFVDYAFSERVSSGIVNVTSFRVWASFFGLTGIGLAFVCFLLAWFCKKEELLQIWKIGKICSIYALTFISIIVLMLWLDFSYIEYEHGIYAKMCFIFAMSTDYIY
jgi:hypothetical protein